MENMRKDGEHVSDVNISNIQKQRKPAAAAAAFSSQQQQATEKDSPPTFFFKLSCPRRQREA